MAALPKQQSITAIGFFNVISEFIFFFFFFFLNLHILHEGMSCRWTCPAGVCVV